MQVKDVAAMRDTHCWLQALREWMQEKPERRVLKLSDLRAEDYSVILRRAQQIKQEGLCK